MLDMNTEKTNTNPEKKMDVLTKRYDEWMAEKVSDKEEKIKSGIFNKNGICKKHVWSFEGSYGKYAGNNTYNKYLGSQEHYSCDNCGKTKKVFPHRR